MLVARSFVETQIHYEEIKHIYWKFKNIHHDLMPQNSDHIDDHVNNEKLQFLQKP